jgi:hypothetical protein
MLRLFRVTLHESAEELIQKIDVVGRLLPVKAQFDLSGLHSFSSTF